MKTNKKILIGLGVGVFLATITVILIKKNKKGNEIPSINISGQSKGGEGCIIFPLKKGSGYSGNPCANEYVKAMQKHLNSKTLAPLKLLKVDGMFGSESIDRLDSIYKISQVSKEFYTKTIK